METYKGQVKTPADAIILFEACRLGFLPRIQRRLSEKERQSIKSGCVYVWDEREAGMRRWTDGKSWSASRVSGSFLTYREMEGKRGGGGGGGGGGGSASFSNSHSSFPGDKDSNSNRRACQDMDLGAQDGPDGYRYKADGLMKQSFSITTNTGQHLHLISYHARSHPQAASLQTPTNDPALRHIRPTKGMYPESTIHDQQNLPPVTRSPMVGSPFDTSPQQHIGPNTQNYLRHPPPPLQQGAGAAGTPHSPAYGAWPPSPMSTPGSGGYYSSPHANYMRQGHPSPANTSSGHSSHYMAQPPYAGAPASTAFDRAPPPMSNGSWPPPPPPSSAQHHHPHHSSYPPSQQPSAPTSAPSPYRLPQQGFTRSPEDRSTTALPPPQSLSQPPSHFKTFNANGTTDHQHQRGPARPSTQPSHGTTSPYTPHPHRESSPRSNGMRTGDHHHHHHHHHHHPSPPPSSHTAGKEPTKMIPSINALINRTPSPPSLMRASIGPSYGDDRHAISDRNSGRPQSGHQYGPTSQAAASDKVSFGEDMRVIRQLDRAFAA